MASGFRRPLSAPLVRVTHPGAVPRVQHLLLEEIHS